MAPNVIGSILCNLILTYSSLRSSPIPTTPSVVPCECSFGKLRSAHAQLRALTSQRGNQVNGGYHNVHPLAHHEGMKFSQDVLAG